MRKPNSHSRSSNTASRPFSAVTALLACFVLTLLWLRAQGDSPDGSSPAEVFGSIAPSVHVPPVRQTPPARTHAIPKPPQYDPHVTAQKRQLPYQLESLRLAIEDLMTSFGDSYPQGPAFLARWDQLWQQRKQPTREVWGKFRTLRRDASLANPLLDFERLLVLKRAKGQLGLPTNHQCNTCLEREGYDNELALLSPVRPNAPLTTVYRPSNGRFVGEMDLHYDADRLLFTMSTEKTWQIFEIGIDGQGLRQVSREVPDVDHFDGCYVPDGRIVLSSTASFTAVPCWHGRERACCLYSMDSQGNDLRQLCFDQDLDLHPSVLSNGQIAFSRWEYTGILHAYVRPLIVMNPDGTGQRAAYGSNSYYPNCLFFPRSVPGSPSKIAAILSGYHGKNRMGELAVVDINVGWEGKSGILHRITHRGEPIVPAQIDALTVGAWPQFLHPWPLNDKYLLTAMQPSPKKPWGIYLVDVFDNVTPILVDRKFDFFEPLPVKKRQQPPTIPSRVDPTQEDAVVVLHDVYRGPGLKGVPRGTVKSLRLVAYNYGFPGLAGPDKIGRAGPWEAMRILGTVPVYEDGSAKFRVPANTPISIQALDKEGKAVQLMRSWYTAMPGETSSCVGCHETPAETPMSREDLATNRPVSEIRPWYGPARGFDFAREVQPVLDRHCVQCHQGQDGNDGQLAIDLRDESLVKDYVGLPLTELGATRLHPSHRNKLADRFQPCPDMPKPYGDLKTLYTPAYDSLIPFVRRVNIEDGAGLLRPGEYHADTSELIQILKNGHHGVQLSSEDWDRLVTWIDLNAPCHGTWGDIADVPNDADRRRHELALVTGGPTIDAESIPQIESHNDEQKPAKTTAPPTLDERREYVSNLPSTQTPSNTEIEDQVRRELTLDLGNGQRIDLVLVPSGQFIMGDTTGDGNNNEWPPRVVAIDRGFWMSRTEVTNAQFQSLVPNHSSGVFTKRQIQFDGPGIQLSNPNQPVVRINWHEATDFCQRLSSLVGHQVTLPTEEQWEYAARAGSDSSFHFGDVTDDFSKWANMADRSLACLYTGTSGVAVLQPIPSSMDFDDQTIGTADVGSFAANAWGLHDMHGNVAEWTRSSTPSTPVPQKQIVRGGSFYDRPQRCRSAFRNAYPTWFSVVDVGFRIVIQDNSRAQ